MGYSLYYQAHVVKKETWFFVAILRSFEHMSFDRTLIKETSMFELYVAPETERYFIELMNYFLETGVITCFEKKENRLRDPEALL